MRAIRSDSYQSIIYMEESQECQVCFTNSSQLLEYRSIIRCIRCGATAHRYCYLPICTRDFICDSCQDGFKGICAICENPGLLKRIDRIYAHPVCLLFSHIHMGNCAHMVSSFKDLSFMPAENGKLPKRILCQECGKTNSAVLKCSLGCNKTSHIYCALKSRIPAESKGWYVNLPFNTAASFTDQFEHIANRRLSSHNDFLKKRLTLSKQDKRDQILIYCQEHSITMVDCSCRTFNEETCSWIYCEGCCRWLHRNCVENQQAAKEAVNNDSTYICMQCIRWNHAINQPTFILPDQTPKLHLYDFIFINHYLEEKKFEVSPQLLEIALKTPVIPGQAYIESQYRKIVWKGLKGTIDVGDLQKQIQHYEGDSNISRLTDKLHKAREQIFYMWWLCQCEMFGDLDEKIKKQKEAPFMVKKHGQLLDLKVIRQVVDLMIKYSGKFKGGKQQQLISLRERLQVGKSEQKNIELKNNNAKNSLQMEKTLNHFNERIRTILNKLKNKKSKEHATACLSQLHNLINSQEITPFHEELPDIPIIQGCIQFKKKQVALRYITALANLDALKAVWKNANFEQPVNPSTQENMVTFVNCFLQTHVYDEKDETVKTLLLKEWGRQQSIGGLPSKNLSLAEPQLFIPNLTFQSLTLRRVNEIILRFEDNYKTNRSEKIQEFIIMRNFLQEMVELPFTQQSIQNLEELTANNWEGPLTKLIPKVIQQFTSLFYNTQQLLSEHKQHKDVGQIGTCVFENWKKIDRCHLSLITRYTCYFQDIRDVRLDLFTREAYDTLQLKLVKLIQCMEQRNPMFDNEGQFKLLTWWCAKLQVIPARAGIIMERDRAFQHGLNLLHPNFENYQVVKRLQEFLNSYRGFFQGFALQFRVKQINIISSWISLYNHVLDSLPTRFFLSQVQAQCFEVTPGKEQPDYFIFKETLSLMRQLRFPECQFLKKFQGVVAEGDKIYSLIEKVFNNCDWGYELSQQFGEKLTLSEFDAIYQAVKLSVFSFKAETIELDIIRDKFEKAEINANSVRIQFQKSPDNTYLQKRAQNMLIIFGSLPISSTSSQFLWNIYERPRMRGLPQNIESYIQGLSNSHQFYSWQALQSLQKEIQAKLQSKTIKKDYMKRLEAMITPSQKFREKYAPLLLKFTQNLMFTESEITMVDKMLQEEKLLQFCDENVMQLRIEYNIYQYIKIQIRNPIPNRIFEPVLIFDLKERLAQLHLSFTSSETEIYKAKVEEEFRRINNQIVKANKEGNMRKGNEKDENQKKRQKQMQKNGGQYDNSSHFSSKMSGMSSQDSNSSYRRQKPSELKTIHEKLPSNRNNKRHNGYY